MWPVLTSRFEIRHLKRIRYLSFIQQIYDFTGGKNGQAQTVSIRKPSSQIPPLASRIKKINRIDELAPWNFEQNQSQ